MPLDAQVSDSCDPENINRVGNRDQNCLDNRELDSKP